MFTDPSRLKPTDAGHPETCACFAILKALGQDEPSVEQRRTGCRAAENDCEDCKEHLIGEVGGVLGPLQERRARYADDPALIEDVLTEGTRSAREVAAETMARVREAMRLTYPGLIRRT